MTALTSWPAGVLVGCLVAAALYWWKRSAFPAVALGVAVAIAVIYVGPMAMRWRAIERVERAEGEVATLLAETKARAAENARLRARVAASEKAEQALKRKVADYERRDRDLAARRQALDQTVVPAAKRVESGDAALGVFQRYGRAWRAAKCDP